MQHDAYPSASLADHYRGNAVAAAEYRRQLEDLARRPGIPDAILRQLAALIVAAYEAEAFWGRWERLPEQLPKILTTKWRLDTDPAYRARVVGLVRHLRAARVRLGRGVAATSRRRVVRVRLTAGRRARGTCARSHAPPAGGSDDDPPGHPLSLHPPRFGRGRR